MERLDTGDPLLMLRLPGGTASIVASKELVVPWWHTQPGYSAQAHFKHMAITWDLLGTICPEKD